MIVLIFHQLINQHMTQVYFGTGFQSELIIMSFDVFFLPEQQRTADINVHSLDHEKNCSSFKEVKIICIKLIKFIFL